MFSILHLMAGLCHSILFLLLLFLVETARAQDGIPWDATSEKSFQYALQMFERASYDRAARQFEKIAFLTPLNHRTSAALLMAARASLMAGDPFRTCSLVDTMVRRFPESSYLPEAFMIAAQARESRKDYVGALRYYALAAGKEDSVAQACMSQIAAILPNVTTSERSAAADRLFREGIPMLQLRDLGILPSHSGGSAAAYPPNAAPWPVLYALLPSMSGSERPSETGRELWLGMEIALMVFNAEHASRAELHFSEMTDGNLSFEMLEGTASHQRIDALLLGSMSEEAKHSIPKLARLGIPLLLPLANDASLTDLASNVFQFNTPLEQRARLLADYVNLMMDTDAVMVLETTDTYISRMSKSFSDRWSALGHSCETRQWRTFESLVGAVNELAREFRGKTRLLVAPAISPGDIANILRAVESVRSDILILGMGDWHHEDVMKRFPSVTALIESDEPFDADSPEWITARDAYKALTGRSFSKAAMFGYDACRIALTVALKTKGNSVDFAKRMLDVFEGVRAPVNFTTGRSNACLSLFRFSQGRFEKLESFYAK